jgi:hypothetical protein
MAAQLIEQLRLDNAQLVNRLLDDHRREREEYSRALQAKDAALVAKDVDLRREREEHSSALQAKDAALVAKDVDLRREREEHSSALKAKDAALVAKDEAHARALQAKDAALVAKDVDLRREREEHSSALQAKDAALVAKDEAHARALVTKDEAHARALVTKDELVAAKDAALAARIEITDLCQAQLAQRNLEYAQLQGVVAERQTMVDQQGMRLAENTERWNQLGVFFNQLLESMDTKFNLLVHGQEQLRNNILQQLEQTGRLVNSTPCPDTGHRVQVGTRVQGDKFEFRLTVGGKAHTSKRTREMRDEGFTSVPLQNGEVYKLVGNGYVTRAAVRDKLLSVFHGIVLMCCSGAH